MKTHKTIIKRITNLPWQTLDAEDLLNLMVLSYVSALEFAESLRMALALYPKDAELKQMAIGELQATNLSFDDYHGPRDHAEFLAHFLRKHRVDTSEVIRMACIGYQQAIKQLPQDVRAMSIFSRESALPHVFTRILEAPGWDVHPALVAYRHYLKRHIALDADAGGHADLVVRHDITDAVTPFWSARLALYQTLFQKPK